MYNDQKFVFIKDAKQFTLSGHLSMCCWPFWPEPLHLLFLVGQPHGCRGSNDQTWQAHLEKRNKHHIAWHGMTCQWQFEIIEPRNHDKCPPGRVCPRRTKVSSTLCWKLPSSWVMFWQTFPMTVFQPTSSLRNAKASRQSWIQLCDMLCVRTTGWHPTALGSTSSFHSSL